MAKTHLKWVQLLLAITVSFFWWFRLCGESFLITRFFRMFSTTRKTQTHLIGYRIWWSMCERIWWSMYEKSKFVTTVFPISVQSEQAVPNYVERVYTNNWYYWICFQPCISEHIQRMIEWFGNNYLFGKTQAVDFLKLAMVCSKIISGAWYAFHTLTERVWRHNVATIVTRVLKFIT